MFCDDCGMTLDLSSKFCLSCGNPIAAASASVHTASHSEPESAPVKQGMAAAASSVTVTARGFRSNSGGE
jgi:hypothetical protein